jgi:Ca-activated chloride channel family protein
MIQKKPVPWAKVCLTVACLCMSFFLSNAFARAQSAEDVHVVPRTGADQDDPRTQLPSTTDSAPQAHVRPIRVDVNLVLVPVAVTDAMNRAVVNLTKRDFALYEGEKAQEIRYFMADDGPISIAVLFDVSRSMTDKIETERAAIHEFFQEANPEDEYFAIAFSNRPRFLVGPTQSTDEVEEKLTSIQPSGTTSMLDAICLAESYLRSARYQRKAIVIISDGGDNASRYTLRETKKLIEESDAQIYAVGLFETLLFNSLEEKLGKKWLSEITDRTGGRTITVQDRTKLPQAAAVISHEIRNQYILGYRPIAGNGKWREIKVKVASPAERPLQAYYKRGYYSAER